MCLETYKLSELHFFATSHHPGIIPEGVWGGGGGGLEIVWSLERQGINMDLFSLYRGGGGVVWLPSPSFYCFGVPVVDLGCDHAIDFNQFISEFIFHMHIST